MTNESMTRRDWMTAVVKGMAIVAVLPPVARGESVPIVLTIYKDPSCGCCGKWVEHLTANGYKPKVVDRTDMDAFKTELGVPQALRSCHTAVFGPFWIEGHVPAADMRKLMATHPAGVVGLAVPGMPLGSPGMENGRRDKYDVIALHSGGKTSVFASHS